MYVLIDGTQLRLLSVIILTTFKTWIPFQPYINITIKLDFIPKFYYIDI